MAPWGPGVACALDMVVRAVLLLCSPTAHTCRVRPGCGLHIVILVTVHSWTACSKTPAVWSMAPWAAGAGCQPEEVPRHH